MLLDITPDEGLQAEGLARELVNRVQKLRKKAHLVPTDQVTVYYAAQGELADIAVNYHQFIESATRTPFKRLAELQGRVLAEEQQQVQTLAFTTSS